MSAQDIYTCSKQNIIMRCEAQLPIFENESVSSLRMIPNRSFPARIAVIGNHLPRQCGIATFTTDLCDAIAAGYGAAELSVVAVNDRLSPYIYPARVRSEITEGDISSLSSSR